MGLLFHSSSSNYDDIDYKRLREDLMDEYGAQMAGYSGGLGYLDMCDERDASEKELIEMAKREGINLCG